MTTEAEIDGIVIRPTFLRGGVDYGDDLEMTTNQQYPPNEDGNGNGNDHTSAVVELVPTEEVQREQLITSGVYNFNA